MSPLKPVVNLLKPGSPNFDVRRSPINMLVLHYTGMETASAAKKRLCDPYAKVSAHYLVYETGLIEQLVCDSHRAWHAGESRWQGENDLNSCSIGIEIVNGGHDRGLPDFPEKQIQAVVDITAWLMELYKIHPSRLVGHSDIAPTRKKDPGEKFPWVELAQRGLIYWPQDCPPDRRAVFHLGERNDDLLALTGGLHAIGYSCRVSNHFDDDLAFYVAAFARRYRPQKICRDEIDVELLSQILSLCAQMDNQPVMALASASQNDET